MTYSPKFYWTNCLLLVLLLGLTWGLGYFDFGVFNLIIALAISSVKALLIVLFFMHIKGSSRLLQLAAITGLFWLCLMLALTLMDYSSRSWTAQEQPKVAPQTYTR